VKSEKLNIVADDLGLHPAINDGIFFAFRNGLINGASLMANGEAFNHALDVLRNLPDANVGVHPHTHFGSDSESQEFKQSKVSVGVHMVLVEERSLFGMKLPKNNKKFFIKYILGMIKLTDIGQELRAQIDKIIQAGIKPSFINSHQHLHLLPGIMDITIKLAIERDIQYIRIVNEPVDLSGGKLFRKFQLLFLNFLSSMAKKKIHRAGLQCNDFFVGFMNAGNLSEKDINKARKLAEKYPDKIIELGCHPGYENEELKKKYKHWGDYNWQKELNLLKGYSI
jgi:predicted glycoside hydrolase/deacetylase ChbG (UPF0249 family)